jgi:hypothetical protein
VPRLFLVETDDEGKETRRVEVLAKPPDSRRGRRCVGSRTEQLREFDSQGLRLTQTQNPSKEVTPVKTRELIALLSKEDPDSEVTIVYAPDDVRYLPVAGVKVVGDAKAPAFYLDWSPEDEALPLHEPGLLEVVMESQYDEITTRHGTEAADKTNYGWGDTEDKVGISYSTKVYGESAEVLTTSALWADRKLTHSWTPYP